MNYRTLLEKKRDELVKQTQYFETTEHCTYEEGFNALLEETLKLVEALEFYADKNQWCASTITSDPESTVIDYMIEETGGKLAREALADFSKWLGDAE